MGTSSDCIPPAKSTLLKLPTYRIQVDIAPKRAHVQDDAIVDQIHGEPDAEEADGDATQVAGTKQISKVLRAALLRWRRQLIIHRQLATIETGRRLNDATHLIDATLDQQPAR